MGSPNKIHTVDAVTGRRLRPTMTGVLPPFSPLVMGGLAQRFLTILTFRQPARTYLVLPELRKPIRRKCCVPRRTLQAPVPEIVRQRTRIVPIVGELVSAGMA
jgi:hypothetical protein